ncbi:hypothetical protein [Sphingopyxis sp. PET50]|uniref:hypothetical protein n=1 Tax=Sphingopyxis sp. PET50 TaxID=2976533 RepID=UPI0021AFC7EB|nr:hypothetical protein [Sphingopyxis sp. PET50]
MSAAAHASAEAPRHRISRRARKTEPAAVITFIAFLPAPHRWRKSLWLEGGRMFRRQPSNTRASFERFCIIAQYLSLMITSMIKFNHHATQERPHRGWNSRKGAVRR